MSDLVFYDKERTKFPDTYKRILTEIEILKVCKKLIRHYKLNVKITLRGNKNNGLFRHSRIYYPSLIPTIVLGRKSTLGTVIHEFSHAREWAKYHETPCSHIKATLKFILSKKLYKGEK